MDFKVGKLYFTKGIQFEIEYDAVLIALEKYLNCDWGELCETDKETNNNAVINGERILGKYKDSKNKEFYIITEWDRSYTTVLLTEEY